MEGEMPRELRQVPPPARYRDFVISFSDRRVLIVGAGGLGCPASLALARAGVGTITLVDPDCVDPSNLHRQLWFRTSDVGRPKVDVAAARISAAFPGVRAVPLRASLGESNAESLFRAHEVVVDATDGIATKFLLSDAAVLTGTPLVHGGVLRLEGQAMEISRGGPCLRCLFERPPDPDEIPTCAQAGVLGSVAGVVGAMQARIALERLRHLNGRLEGQSILRIFDGATLKTREVVVRRAVDCAACGESAQGSQRLLQGGGRAACVT
jgi:molybdopterin-synthase adenylyltransferase